MEEKNPLKDYVWNTGNTFEIMRLLVEGAITLYEDDTTVLITPAAKAEQPEARIALSDIGGALYELRRHIKRLQIECYKEAYRQADELKVIIECEEDFAWAEKNAREVSKKCRLYLQPEWSRAVEMMPLIVEYAKAHPAWSISIQSHKYMHIP